MEKKETLRGTIKSVRFHNDNNGFSIFVVRTGRDKTIPVLCYSPEMESGDEITAVGSYINDPKWGPEFKATNIDIPFLGTKEGVRRLLANGFLPGIRGSTAFLLVEKFGDKVFDVLEESPDEFLSVRGISEKKLAKIEEAYKEKRHERKCLTYCSQLSMTIKMSEKLYNHYGDMLIEILKKDPYRLIYDIKGISFARADKIARNSGISAVDPNRIKAGVTFVMSESDTSGNCAYPREELVRKAKGALSIPDDGISIPDSFVERGIDDAVSSGNLVLAKAHGEPCLFLPYVYESEQRTARNLIRLRDGMFPSAHLPFDVESAIHDAETKASISLEDAQHEAVKMSVENNLLVITGGPGVGKTTIVKAIISIYERYGNKVLCAAPTGRAAKRMFESTKHEAKTIHRLLEFNPESYGFNHNEENPLEGDLLIVDECSMVDARLMDSLLRAVPSQMRVIFVGDVDQLPSVGAGQVLLDMIRSGVLPVARLTKIFRQSDASRIIVAAHDVNNGKMPSLKNKHGDDFSFFPVDSPEQCVQYVLDLVTRFVPSRLGYDPLRDIQVLCPMKGGAMGTEAMNLILQERLNGNARKKSFMMKTSESVFFLGDKVMQTRNDYKKDVYNGDIGFVSEVSSEGDSMLVSFDGGTRSVLYSNEEAKSLRLSYACTVHKSQGSEYPVVIMPVMTNHFKMLQRKLLYTGITRGKDLVILVGQVKAVAIAVHGQSDEEERWTKLEEWLRRFSNQNCRQDQKGVSTGFAEPVLFA